jgi:F-type H+-transporting ATPase subunit b
LLAEQDYSFLFNLDAQLLFDTILLAVAIFFLFLIMSYLLFNPARKLLKDRQDRIENDINSAKDDKESAAALKAEYEGKLKQIDKEAEVILSEARQKAVKNEAKIIDEAKEEASRIIKRAQEEAELERSMRWTT